MECDLTNKQYNSQSCTESSASTKRPRQPETIDLRSPVYQRNTKNKNSEIKAENNFIQALKQKVPKNNFSSYNLQEGFYKSFVLYIFFQILEENML